MREYILGLGISVKICSLYEELVCLTLCNSNHTEEYYSNIEKLRNLIDEETEIYDKLDDDDIIKYFNKINEEDMGSFDSVKSRYYSKLKERNNLLEDDLIYEYPFTFETAILGKILMDTLVKLEKHFVDSDLDNNETLYNLYSYHNAHKFTLISSNDFLERIAIDFEFNLLDMPNIDFVKIRDNFKFKGNLYIYLNKLLYIMGVEIINNLNNGLDEIDIYSAYTNMLYLAELEVLINSLDKPYLYKLISYCDNNNISNSKNGIFIEKILKKSK